MSVAVTGRTAVPAVPADSHALEVAGNNTVRASATIVLTGLGGSTSVTFTAKYKASGGTASFANRDLVVVPLPGPVVSTQH
jgi:hypothetical protein